MTKRFDSVFDAISNTEQEALSLKLRASLMRELDEIIANEHWTQKQAAKQLGVTQPRISDLRRGKLSLFSLDTLVNMIAAAGRDVSLRVA
ncbi:MAG: XRE family transcriptional regulator [Candidatus Thiodiazotropha endolucinida]|nr:XRE family transcriptional regulator [Candidatus Thiodiazotropha taylori]MCW4312718.1 XRE family transcriptional regulator [Candidatus Thiodiazotropha taylori]